MKKIIFLVLVLMGINYAQVTAKVHVPSGLQLFFATPAMTDSASTTGYFSGAIHTFGLLPSDLFSYPLKATVLGSGTADSVAVTIQGRQIVYPASTGSDFTPSGNVTYSNWVTIDTVVATFNKVDSNPYYYTSGLNLNGYQPDQIRLHVYGQSTVNRSDVKIKVWLNFIDHTKLNH